jgi:hypothetical protein
MNHLIDSYSVTGSFSNVNTAFQTVSTFSIDQYPPLAWSITIKNIEDYGVNKRVLDAINEMESLPDNWDESDAISPNKSALQLARLITLYMDAIGQEIYSTAPGPTGEVMLDFRNKNKSFELIFYRDRNKYVKFPEIEPPEQGLFTPEIMLPELISWLNT